MHYEKLLRVGNSAFNTQQSQQIDKTSEIINILKKLSEQTAQTMPSDLENSNLTDSDVETLLKTLLRFQKEYFPNIPIKHELDKQFVWNVPKDVIRGAHICETRELPDILNPMILLYPFLTESPSEIIGVYLDKIASLIDEDRELIDHDMKTYLETLEDNTNE